MSKKDIRRIALIHVKVMDAPDPPLGLMSIAGVLKQQGYEVRIWDEFKNEAFLQQVRDYGPDLIGFSVLSSQMAWAKRLTARLHAQLACPVVWGGIHPSVLSEDCLRNGGADVVVIGEGEATFLELVQRWATDAWQDVRGLAYLAAGEFVQTPARELIPDLDTLPFPDYGMLDLQRVFIPPGSVRGHFLRATAHISTSRGCPNRCIYCNCPTLFGTRVRKRSAANVVAEIKALTGRFPQVEGIWFVDDTFTTYPSWVEEFCDRMIAAGLQRLVWSCQTRVTHVRPGMLHKMKAAGCVQVEYGLESGCDRVLQVIKKNVRTGQMREAVALAKQAGLDVFGTFMLGNPTETEAEMEQTFAFAKSLPLDGCRFFFTTPFPGTELYTLAQQQHWLSADYAFDETLSLRQTHPGETTDAPLMVCELPAKRLMRLRARYQNHFFWRNYLVYARQWRLILAMVLALCQRPRLFFQAVFYTLKSLRLDSFVEHMILAWRMKKLSRSGAES